jgi:hypothetical protein
MTRPILYAVASVFLMAVLLAAPAMAGAQVTSGSGMAAVNGFYFRANPDGFCDPVTCSGFTLGGSAGYNFTKYLGLFGEYQFERASVNNVELGNNNGHSQNFGGAVRFYLYPKGRVVPFGVFGVGRVSESDTAGGKFGGTYFGGGGGALCYIGRHWGIAPEVRYQWDRDFLNYYRVAAGVFYQFGGMSKKSKK